jgi:hypothetical protein
MLVVAVLVAAGLAAARGSMRDSPNSERSRTGPASRQSGVRPTIPAMDSRI